MFSSLIIILVFFLYAKQLYAQDTAVADLQQLPSKFLSAISLISVSLENALKICSIKKNQGKIYFIFNKAYKLNFIFKLDLELHNSSWQSNKSGNLAESSGV
jgi:hypothetical protein